MPVYKSFTQVPKCTSSKLPNFPGSQAPKFLNAQVPKYPRSQVPKFPGSQILKYPNSQVSKFPSSYVPQCPKRSLKNLIYIPTAAAGYTNMKFLMPSLLLCECRLLAKNEVEVVAKGQNFWPWLAPTSRRMLFKTMFAWLFILLQHPKIHIYGRLGKSSE